MNMHFSAIVTAIGMLTVPQAFAQDIVADDLITNANQTSEWLNCDANSPAVDITNLDAGGCAFRTAPAVENVTYRLSCGITVAKFASITLAFLDVNDDTILTDSTEVTEHVTGAYSVTLEAPSGTVTAAIGIYGEPGSGFQDCALVDTTPDVEPTRGSIAGRAWFDENRNNFFSSSERIVGRTTVSLFQDGDLIDQLKTGTNGRYNFGNLDIDACYTLQFISANATLEIGAPGGDNDALSNGFTNEICLTESVPDAKRIDAAFVPSIPDVPPADNRLCGLAWVDVDGNGQVNNGDNPIANLTIRLFDAENKQIEKTTTDDIGLYNFNELPDGVYSVSFDQVDGHTVTASAAAPAAGLNVLNANRKSPAYSLPSDSNTAADAACTISQINGGFIPTPVALEPTIAKNDEATNIVGTDFSIDFLANDAACEGSVAEVDILGHNVPGTVTYNANQQVFQVSNTTFSGVFSIEYGIRGACGSYGKATITVELNDPIVITPNAPEAPLCRIETGGNEHNGGVDVFSPTENGFVTSYSLYDIDRQLVVTLDSDDSTHRKFINTDAFNQIGFTGNWEIEWNGTDYGYDQVSIYFMSAIENGVESPLSECARVKMSPIAIDLTDEGRIQRVDGEFHVDIDGNGTVETLRQWFAPTAGILVTSNATGKISGEYLFGNVSGVYADGFEELATLDKNSDGQLNDLELNSLAIWIDGNSNTIVDAGELSSLEDHNIVALEVEHYKFMARATQSSGKQLLMEDVWLPLSPIFTAENR